MEEDCSKGQEHEGTPTSGFSGKPTVVGIGASAGGLAALKRLFERIPYDSGLAFVVVVHLSPEHKSHLADLLQSSVGFPVQQVTESVPLEANNVYVIPPNANLSTIDTHLRLSKLEEQRRERAPIDHFFRTLASTHDGHSIGVILTGTGSDGTLGLKEIKAKGGLILVQDPNEAEFDGMPQSAIATGLVDRVLPIAEIAEALLRLTQVGPRISITGNGDDPERALLPKVLAILKARTERDFSRYKTATILRRISRRMQLNYIENFELYLDKLRESPEETRALADDLLITVTSFFRDQDVFQKLEKEIVPHLFEGKGPEDTLRIWSVGCATGEEAYSVAMLLLEEAGRRNAPPRIQIFASDLHKRSLEGAREGLYPGDIETDVSAERLKRFFHKENGGYRIAKEVRDTVVFAPHNLLGDPPFSRLNLIACRNLLIYLDRSVQRDVIDLFHYALCPNGYLLLGCAETIDASELFRTEDKKLCLYQKRNVPAPEPRLPVFPLTRLHITGERSPNQERVSQTPPFHLLHQRLLEQYAPPSILVGQDNRLVHLSEHAGRYLVHPGGEVTLSVINLVREELRIDLQSLLQTARETKELADSEPILVRFNGHTAPVVMHVRAAEDADQDGFVLVIFEEHQPQRTNAASGDAPRVTAIASTHDGKRIAELEAELNAARQRLQTTIEEYETSQEEMKASSEEMQSTNEELRSTMEELETSKEELQSINEELQTVNQENRHKVEELTQLSSDLQNLLSATDIATLFLDRDLRILRFTPRLAELFNIRVTDRGRPISDLTHRLRYPQLDEDAGTVLDRLIPAEREIRDDRKRWYLARVLPYRSTEDRIEGVVITFTDITTQKLAHAVLGESEERQAFLLKLSDELRPLHDPIQIQVVASRLLGEYLHVDRAAYGELEPDGETMTVIREWKKVGAPSILGRYRIDEFGAFFTRPLREGGISAIEDALNDPRVARDTYDQTWGAIHTRSAIAYALVKRGKFVAAIFVHQNEPRAWSGNEMAMVSEVGERTWEAVERTRAEEALRASEGKYRLLFQSMGQGYAECELVRDKEGRAVDHRLLDLNPAFERLTGVSAATARGGLAREVFPDLEVWWTEAFERIVRGGKAERIEFEATSLGRWYEAWVYPGSGDRFVEFYEDITERKRAEAALCESEERQRTLLEGIPQLVWRSRDNGEWIWASPQWLRFTGQSQQESAGHGWLNAVHPDDQDPTRHAWARASAEGLLDLEYRIRRASDGAYFWHHTRAVPVRAPNDRVLEWLGTSTDIEDLKSAQAARLEAGQKFRLFVENVQEYALVQTDPDGLITNWNPGAERLFGYTPEQMLGRSFSFLLTPEDQTEGVFRKELALVRKGERHEDARWFVRQDDSRFWARWITEPMRDETGLFRGLAKIMRDETERERAEAFTRHSLAEKEELLKEVHHRVKNNLQVIISLLNMQAFQIRDERVLALFQETRNRVLAISSIHELLYRAESFAQIKLSDYARQLVSGLVRFYGLEQRVRVEIVGDDITLELERAVPYGMLLNELVSNACKHAFPSPQTGTLAIGIEREGDDIVLTATDTGPGLPDGFDYQKASSLGLKLVHGLVRQLRGTIEIASRPGTRVAVRFPAAGTEREE